MNTREVREEIEELNRIFASISEDGNPVVVEGKKDAEALRALGVEVEILVFNRGESVTVFCERVAAEYRRVVILTDWDRTGRHLAHLLVDGFRSVGVECNMEYRARIAGLCRRETKDVEGLYRHYRRLKMVVSE